MADNTTLNSGTGGDTISTDDIGGGVKVQRVKVQHGADGSATDVSTASPLPVGGAAAENAAASGNPVLSGGRYDLSARTLNDGDVGAFGLDINGYLKNSPNVAAKTLADANTNSAIVTVEEAGATYWTPTLPFAFNGTTWDRVRGDATNGLTVNLGTNNDVTLNANSGVDIGDVDVTSIIPGTGATNSGKAIDSVVGSTDTGVAILGKHQEDQVHLTTADGDYDVLTLDSLGSVHVNAEAHHIFDTFNATTGWTALNSDTLNLATTTKHVSGTAALTFDKVNGAANTVFAAIQKTLSSVDLGAVSPHDLLQGTLYIPDLTNVSYCFLRLGTDSSNYNEWRLPDTALTAATFEVGALIVGDANYAGITGNGWNPAAITYICVGVAFDNETDTLAGIVFDEISYHTNQHTSATLNAEVSSSVSSPNVRLNGYGGSTDVNTGNASANTLRVVLATDQPTVEVDGAETENAAVAGNPVLMGGRYDATPRTLNDGDAGALALDVNGHAITSAHAASTALTDNVSNSVNLMVDEAEAFMGTGTFPFMFDGSTWDRLRGDATNGLTVNLGTNNDVTLNANSGVDIGDVDVTSISAGSNLIGDVGISGARTSGGTTLYKNIDVDETEDQIKGTAGQIYWIHAINLKATPLYLKFYNATAASVTVGTTVPDLTFPVPSQGDANGAGFTLPIPNGIAFSTAITIAATTGLADNDSGAPGPNELIVNLGYA